jgi:heterodisulfide reductase subunit A
VEEKRIGVFICNCGTNIAGFLDAADVAQYASGLPGVVFTRENLFSCSEAGVSDIKSAIRDNELNRVVVAACTPRTHEPTFRAACEEAGLNPYLFEFVNVREHCSWVHKQERESATRKAMDLVRMAVARVALLEPAERIRTDVLGHAVVVGGGVSGMTAALTLARLGVGVTVVEKTGALGGLVRRLDTLSPDGRDAGEYVAGLVDAVKAHERIGVVTGAEVRNVEGYIGNYGVTVRAKGRERTLRCGAIVVAIGAEPLDPEGLFGHDGKRVVTLLELEGLLRKGRVRGKRFVMIQCAGARTRDRVYCSRICCASGVKDALLLKKAVPDASVHVLYRDLMCYGIENERALRLAKEAGVRFVSYSAEAPPVVENGVVKVTSDVLGIGLEIEFDQVILATPLVATADAARLSRLLKVPLDQDAFFLEAHVKLRPVDFATDGIFICGTARWPATTRECVEQATGAAARAAIPLLAGDVEVEPIVAVLAEPDLCRGCGMCASICPYSAIEIVDTDEGRKARMIEVACKGCGTCGATCYVRAITMVHYKDEQIEAQVGAAFAE